MAAREAGPCMQVLGRALKDLPREEIFVATKVGRYGGGAFDFSAERVTKSVHESLERLQVSQLCKTLLCALQYSAVLVLCLLENEQRWYCWCRYPT